MEFLGKVDQVKSIHDARELFLKRLSNVQADNMVRQVSNDEIKEAMFGRGDVKSPSPDGFTSSFFKRSWDIVGEDVYRAVSEFFFSGHMLKELNNTVIALLPKVTTPNNTTDYRLIACCNVIYKCISKIIGNRMKEGLIIVVSENQSAFVRGRRISDNILLTHEMLCLQD